MQWDVDPAMSGGEEARAQAHGYGVFAFMAGSVLGAALQLQQAVLWGRGVYAALVLAALAGWLLSRVSRRVLRVPWPIALLLGALAGAGSVGWRASVYAQGALSPALEGRDLEVVGVVSQMPQRGAGAVRFLFEPESARWTDANEGGAPVVPARISLGWYADNTGLWGRSPEEALPFGPADAPSPVHAGERWRLTVRLKAPHGNLNPYGFDQELRWWELGVQAIGYVRAGARDARAERIGDTWLHPIEQAREKVRDAVLARVADRARAGVIAALVAGDQNAIELLSYNGVVTPRNSAFRGKT